MSDRKTRYSPLYAEDKRDVTNDVMFAYVHEKINILLSVLSIFSFIFYELNLNIHGFVYLEFVKYQLGFHRNVQIFAKCKACISAIQLFYMAFFLYRNKSYIFPMLGLAKNGVLESVLIQMIRVA